MFIDARELPSDTELACDLCIIGGGAAGISIARRLRGSKLDICLLESGGLEPDAETQALYAGSGVGVQGDEYVGGSRLRFFGGSTNHWAGLCAPLDEYDFAARDWVPGSGWPISRSQLEPHYAEAQTVCELGPYQYDPAAWRLEGETPPFSSDRIAMRVWQLSPPTRFGARYRADLEADPHLSVYLHANALQLEPDRDVSRVVRVHAGTLSGVRFHVTARTYVIACGGIENPRLLLLSNQVTGRGLGNQNDQVGRYFMDHPHLQFNASPAAVMFTRHPAYESTNLKIRGNTRIRPGFCLTHETQKREGLLNTIFTLKKRTAAAYPLSEGVASLMHRLAKAPPHPLTGSNSYIFSKAESVPDPESRVTLGDDIDALGQRRAVVDWRLGSLDRISLQRSLRILAAEVGRTGAGRIRLADWLIEEEFDWKRVGTQGGGHHMGTTRMSDDPRTGVVDANCRIHGLDNVYVAGSSVYPTTGWANPTLTLVALSLRLADHLRRRASA